MIFLSACQLKDIQIEDDFIVEKDSPVVSMDTIPNTDEFTLSTFDTFPEELNGCSCYFSFTKNAFNDKQFIFAGQLQDSMAFLKKQNNWVKLKQNHPTVMDTLCIEAKNDSITMIIKGLKQSSAYETTQYKAEMKVEKDGKVVFNGDVYGECGC